MNSNGARLDFKRVLPVFVIVLVDLLGLTIIIPLLPLYATSFGASAFTIGLDFGTNSVRSVVVDCADGREIGTSVFDYPSGDQGILLDPGDPHLARQNPADYLAGLEASARGALEEAGSEAPVLGYTVPYAMANVFLTLLGPVIVLTV